MNPAELERIYDSFAGGLYRYVLRILGSEEDARDVLQDVFVKLALSNKSMVLHHEKSFLFRMAHNLAMDLLRRRRSEGVRAERLKNLAESEDQSYLTSMSLEADDSLNDALDILPVEQRTVVHLRIWDELTFEEIGTALGISLNTAASRYRYALEKLRAHLHTHQPELP